MTRFVINLDAVDQILPAALMEIGEEIADATARGAQMAEYRFRPSLKVTPIPGGVRVSTHNSLAHIDEWGGANVRSHPTGAMRAAAADAGQFRPA